jgi:hypothetical protein
MCRAVEQDLGCGQDGAPTACIGGEDDALNGPSGWPRRLTESKLSKQPEGEPELCESSDHAFYLPPALALDALRINTTAPRCSKRISSINVFIK